MQTIFLFFSSPLPPPPSKRRLFVILQVFSCALDTYSHLPVGRHAHLSDFSSRSPFLWSRPTTSSHLLVSSAWFLVGGGAEVDGVQRERDRCDLAESVTQLQSPPPAQPLSDLRGFGRLSRPALFCRRCQGLCQHSHCLHLMGCNWAGSQCKCKTDQQWVIIKCNIIHPMSFSRENSRGWQCSGVER